MADLSVTAANCVKGSNAIVENGHAGETITAGQVVYLDSSTNLYMKADADAATAAARNPRGIALNSASLNQPLAVQTKGDLTLGATLTAGISYYLSGATAGGIAPVADVGTGEYYVLIGLATSTSVLRLSLNYSGVSA